MANSAAAVTVATTATALHTGSVNPQYVTVYNNDASASIFVGGTDVSTTAGITVAAGRSLSLMVAPGEIWYACCASSTVNARVAVSKL